MNVLDERLTADELAQLTREIALALDDGDYTELRDSTGAPYAEKPIGPELLLNKSGIESNELISYGEPVTMPCANLETPWRTYGLRRIPTEGVYYRPCDGVLMYFKWSLPHQKWSVQLRDEGNSEAFAAICDQLRQLKAA